MVAFSGDDVSKTKSDAAFKRSSLLVRFFSVKSYHIKIILFEFLCCQKFCLAFKIVLLKNSFCNDKKISSVEK